MKKNNLFILLGALVVVGCTTQTDSSSSSLNSETSSSTFVSSSSSSNSSISSSSTLDKTYWIEKGNAQNALANVNKWYYNVDETKVNVTNANYFEGELFFDFNKTSDVSWNSVELFYHDSNITEGTTYNVSFKISSSVEGNVTINGEVVSLTQKTKEVTVNSTLEASQSAIEIQFGSEENGYLGDVEIIISELNIVKEEKLTLKKVLEDATTVNNYTVEMIDNDWGLRGTYVFLEKAAYFEMQDGGNYERRGFGENDEGVFGFSSTSSRNQNYFYDDNDKVVKGLYTNREAIDFSDSKGESVGVPSLHHLNPDDFNFELVTGEVVNITGSQVLNSLKVFARMGGDYVNSIVYSGVSKASVVLNNDGSVDFEIKNKMNSYIKVKISNVGTTTNEMLEAFIASNNFGPINMTPTVEADPVVQSILKLVDGDNYTVKKTDGSYLYINEKYSYSESTDEDNVTTARGFVTTSNGAYQYTIIDNQITLGDMDYSIYSNWSIKAEEGLKSSVVTYFDSALEYKYNEDTERYEMTPSSTNYSYVSFSSDFFSVNATSCSLITLKLDSSTQVLTIGAEFTYVDVNEESKTEYLTIEVSDFETTTVQVMEDYLAQ